MSMKHPMLTVHVFYLLWVCVGCRPDETVKVIIQRETLFSLLVG